MTKTKIFKTKIYFFYLFRSRLSDKMDEKVVSHAQLHLRFFPGYRLVIALIVVFIVW